MSSEKTVRTLAVVASAALLLGAVAVVPAGARAKKCAPFETSGVGAEAETSIVTDKATADAPIEVTIATDPGAGFTNADDPSGDTGATSHKFHNVQVDSKAKTAKLFVRAEFLPSWDYDLFLRLPEGPSVAYEADFNPLTVGGPTPVGGTSNGHAEPGVSQIDGQVSLDCEGFTVDVGSSITPGGEVTLKFWLEK